MRITKPMEGEAVVYAIQYVNCNKRNYMGETSCDIQKRIYEHKRDLIKVNMSNGFIRHILKTNYNVSF